MKHYQNSIRDSQDDEPSFVPASPTLSSLSISHTPTAPQPPTTTYIPSPSLSHSNDRIDNNFNRGGEKSSKDYRHLSVVMAPEIPHSPELGTTQSQSYDSSKFKGIFYFFFIFFFFF